MNPKVVPDPPPTPSAAQAQAIKVSRRNNERRPVRASVKLGKNDGNQLEINNPHSDGPGWVAHLNDTFGTVSDDSAGTALARLERVVRPQGSQIANEIHINASLALLGAIGARDELEAAIGEQIVSTHVLSMDLMGRAKHADTIAKIEAYTSMATKVSRTMATHIEALTRLRSGGQQRITVKHVHVQGDAVVGDHAQAVFGGGHRGRSARKVDQPLEPRLSPIQGAALLCADASGYPVPIGGDAGKATVRASRGKEPRRTGRERERAVHDRPLDQGAAGRETTRARRAVRAAAGQ